MLQVNLWLTAKVGDPFLYRCFWAASSAIAAGVVIYAVLRRLGLFKLLGVLAVFLGCYILGESQQYFVERTHILSYGLLGLLAARDMADSAGALGPSGGALAAGFVALVSAADEGFQSIIPNRYCQMGDFVTNVTSGALGMALYMAIRARPGRPQR
jgi:VanZ family protein